MKSKNKMALKFGLRNAVAVRTKSSGIHKQFDSRAQAKADQSQLAQMLAELFRHERLSVQQVK
jgi:hypothetical protein